MNYSGQENPEGPFEGQTTHSGDIGPDTCPAEKTGDVTTQVSENSSMTHSLQNEPLPTAARPTFSYTPTVGEPPKVPDMSSKPVTLDASRAAKPDKVIDPGERLSLGSDPLSVLQLYATGQVTAFEGELSNC